MENTEKAILEAAEKEFMEKGFSGARTVSIAERAGVTHAMLHYYFRTKQHLFDQILEQKIRLVGESIWTFLGNRDLSYGERIRSGIANHFDFLVKNPELPRFFSMLVFSSPEHMELFRGIVTNLLSSFFGDFQRLLDQAAERGEIGKVNALELLLDIVSLNTFVFLALPVLSDVFSIEDREAFLERRKNENIELIMRRLQQRG